MGTKEIKLLAIEEYIIDKMHMVVEEDKIGSTEQLLNFAKAYKSMRKHDEVTTDGVMKEADKI